VGRRDISCEGEDLSIGSGRMIWDLACKFGVIWFKTSGFQHASAEML